MYHVRMPAKHSDLVESMRNLNPRISQQLASVEINTIDKLRATGSVEAYVKLLRGCSNVGPNMLYALEGALTNTHWEVVAREQGPRLQALLEQYEKDNPPPG
jgi:DNA transformation protein and related proteins